LVAIIVSALLAKNRIKSAMTFAAS
jgi:hypothetical protein